jgi:hypothetical protein
MAHSDLDELLNALLRMAEMLLAKHGEFYPIGAIVLPDGEVRHVGAKIDGDEHPPSQSLIDLLTEIFKKEAKNGKIRAAGICYDALTVPPGQHRKQDAVCCGLEHSLGDSIYVFRPYARADDGSFQYDELFVSERTPQFFCEVPRS